MRQVRAPNRRGGTGSSTGRVAYIACRCVGCAAAVTQVLVRPLAAAHATCVTWPAEDDTKQTAPRPPAPLLLPELLARRAPPRSRNATPVTSAVCPCSTRTACHCTGRRQRGGEAGRGPPSASAPSPSVTVGSAWAPPAPPIPPLSDAWGAAAASESALASFAAACAQASCTAWTPSNAVKDTYAC